MSKTKLTFEQRCRLTETCLPEAPFRSMLVDLHDEMLARIAERDALSMQLDMMQAHEATLEEKNKEIAELRAEVAAIDAVKGETK